MSLTLPIGHRCLTQHSIRADIELFSERGAGSCGAASVSKSELSRVPGFEVADAGVKVLGVFALRDFYRRDLVSLCSASSNEKALTGSTANQLKFAPEKRKSTNRP
jgi:hypothetical protein